MPNPKLSIIAAVAENRAIGKDNKLLWSLPEDMERFKKITTGHVVIMGQKTFESIGKPLPGRTNIIISWDENFKQEGCTIAHSVDEALRLARDKVVGLAQGDDEIFIIGGGSIYQQTIGMADKLYLTLVEGNFEADTFFPDYSDFKKVVFEKDGEDAGFKFKFLELER